MRSFGPWSCKKSGKSSPGPAKDPTVRLAGGQRPSGFVSEKQTCLSLKVGTMQGHAGGEYCIACIIQTESQRLLLPQIDSSLSGYCSQDSVFICCPLHRLIRVECSHGATDSPFHGWVWMETRVPRRMGWGRWTGRWQSVTQRQRKNKKRVSGAAAVLIHDPDSAPGPGGRVLR